MQTTREVLPQNPSNNLLPSPPLIKQLSPSFSPADNPTIDLSQIDITFYSFHEVRKIIYTNPSEVISRKEFFKPILLNLGYAPLEWATETKNLELIDLLLCIEAPISNNAIIFFISKGLRPPLMKYLTTHPFIPEPLFKAAIDSEDTEIVELFIRHDPTLKKSSAISWAMRSNQLNILKILVAHGFSITLQNWDLVPDDSNFLKYLIDTIAPIAEVALLKAIIRSWNNLLREIIEKNVPIRPNALSHATKYGNLFAVELLIHHRAPFALDSMHMAISTLFSNSRASDAITIIEKLFAYGIPLLTSIPKTVFSSKSLEIYNFLIKKNIPITEETIYGAIENNLTTIAIELICKTKIRANYLCYLPRECSEEFFDFLCQHQYSFYLDDESALTLIFKAHILFDRDLSVKAIKMFMEKGIRITKHNVNHLIFNDINLLKLTISENEELIKFIDFQKILLSNNREQACYFLALKDINIALRCFKQLKDNVIKEKLLAKLISHFTNKPIPLIKHQHLIEYMKILEEYSSFLEDAIDDDQDYILFAEKVLKKIRYTNLSLTQLFLYTLSPNQKIWREFFPNFDPPIPLTSFSPWGFDPDVYQEILPVTKSTFANNLEEAIAEINAYKLTVLFGSLRNAKIFLEKYRTKMNGTLQEAYLFELPKKGIWNIEMWREIVEKKWDFSVKKMHLLSFAVDIERNVDGILPPYSYASKAIQSLSTTNSSKITMADFYKEELISLLVSSDRYKHSYQEIQDRCKRNSKKIQQEIRTLLWNALDDWMGEEKKKFLDKKALSGQQKTVLMMQSATKKKLHTVQKIEKTAANTPSQLPEFLLFLADQRNISKKNYSDFINVIIDSIYGSIDKQYTEMAYEFIKSNTAKVYFDEALDIITNKEKKYTYIPDVKLTKGAYCFETMTSKDPMIFILGEKTHSCQNINGPGLGRTVTLHGARSPFGGFVKISKPLSKDPWVAQSWTGLTQAGEIVFDSVEYNIGHDTKEIMDLYKLAAEEILRTNPLIKRVLFGSGGNTPKEHGFSLLPAGPQGYPHIIELNDIGSYDSAAERFILAAQQPSRSAAVPTSILKVAEGIDTFIHRGKKIHGLSLHALYRIHFFDFHPKTLRMIRQEPLNPLLEEGYYNGNWKNRERIGEDFITHDAVTLLLQEKFKNKNRYHVDNLVIDVINNNDFSHLHQKLSEIKPLEDNENILIASIDGIHATAIYIQNLDNALFCIIVDPEIFREHSLLIDAVRLAFPSIEVFIVKEKLQTDYYSASTFLLKSLGYFAKSGAAALHSLKNKKTPAALLKMAQGITWEECSIEIGAETVNSKGKTLANYIQSHTVQIDNRFYNAAALKKRYKYFDDLEKILTPFS